MLLFLYKCLTVCGSNTQNRGHVFNQDHLPPMQAGDILVHGHTHLLKAEKAETECGTITVLNPGSVSIPKGGNPNTYAPSVR